jgi:hypothetical protein
MENGAPVGRAGTARPVACRQGSSQRLAWVNRGKIPRTMADTGFRLRDTAQHILELVRKPQRIHRPCVFRALTIDDSGF